MLKILWSMNTQITRLLFAPFLLLTASVFMPSLMTAQPSQTKIQTQTDLDEPLNHPLTMSELVNIALKNNPETKQAWWNAQRAAANVGIANSAYYPKLGLNASAAHGRDFKFINGPDVNYTILRADLVLSYLLFDFGERAANVESAKMGLLAANWQTDFAMQKVIIRVLENAYSTINAQNILDASLISLEEAEKLQGITKELNRVGLNPITDIYTSQATLSQMQMDVAQQKANLDIQRGKLAAALGFSADTPLQIAPIAALDIPQKQCTAELINLAKQVRADLMAKQARVWEQSEREDKARSAYGPKVSFSSRGGADHAVHDKANGLNYEVKLNLDFPLFNGFETFYQNVAAYADTMLSVEDLAKLELDISLEVMTYSRNFEAAQEMLSYAEDNLKNATSAFDGVLDKYKAGKERMTEVSNAQRQLAAARVRFSEVKTKWLVSLANLAYATGTLAPYMEDGTCAENP